VAANIRVGQLSRPNWLGPAEVIVAARELQTSARLSPAFEVHREYAMVWTRKINLCLQLSGPESADIFFERPVLVVLALVTLAHASVPSALARPTIPIKNPAEHHKDEATGPEQRRGLSVSQANGDENNKAIAFHYDSENAVVPNGRCSFGWLRRHLADQLLFL
jgi:hypothetical protein